MGDKVVVKKVIVYKHITNCYTVVYENSYIRNKNIMTYRFF